MGLSYFLILRSDFGKVGFSIKFFNPNFNLSLFFPVFDNRILFLLKIDLVSDLLVKFKDVNVGKSLRLAELLNFNYDQV